MSSAVEISESALRLENRGRKAHEIQEHISGFLLEEKAQVVKSVMERLRGGETLDPGFAVQAWIHFHALRKIEVNLERDIKKGVAASKRNAAMRPPIGAD